MPEYDDAVVHELLVRRVSQSVDGVRDFINRLFYLFPQIVEGVDLVGHDIEGNVADVLHQDETSESAGRDKNGPRDAVLGSHETPAALQSPEQSEHHEACCCDDERKTESYGNREPAASPVSQILDKALNDDCHPGEHHQRHGYQSQNQRPPIEAGVELVDPGARRKPLPELGGGSDIAPDVKEEKASERDSGENDRDHRQIKNQYRHPAPDPSSQHGQFQSPYVMGRGE